VGRAPPATIRQVVWGRWIRWISLIMMAVESHLALGSASVVSSAGSAAWASWWWISWTS